MPTISVVIPNYNGKAHLEKCLPSLKSQTFADFELVLVDNGSSDESTEYAMGVFDDATVVRNMRNLGFAVAVNQGVRASHGKYILALNNDTVLEPDCIEILLTELEARRAIAPHVMGMAPKILFLGKPIIDAVGNAVNSDCSAFNIGIGQIDLGQFDKPRQVPGLCFAAALIDREAFQRVGMLDESYFAYYEDVDWCYRANVLGFEFYSAPRAVVYHFHSASAKTIMTSAQKYYLIHRNLLRTLFKNYFRGNLLRGGVWLWMHLMSAVKALINGRTTQCKMHLQIIAITILYLPLLLARNLSLTLRRCKTDFEIWNLASDPLAQISSQTFEPSTYSPVIGLDIFQMIFYHLTVMQGLRFLKEYLAVHTVNALWKMGLITFPRKFSESATSASPTSKRLKDCILTRVGTVDYLLHHEGSFVVDEFTAGLLLALHYGSPKSIRESLKKMIHKGVPTSEHAVLDDSLSRTIGFMMSVFEKLRLTQQDATLATE